MIIPFVNRNNYGLFTIIWDSGIINYYVQESRKVWNHGFLTQF
jgi:hypothetical protein